jgi:hypothetical protein
MLFSTNYHHCTVGFHLEENLQKGRAQEQELKEDQSVEENSSSSCFYFSSSSSSLKPQLK